MTNPFHLHTSILIKLTVNAWKIASLANQRLVNCVLASLHLHVHTDFLKAFGNTSHQKFEDIYMKINTNP